MESASRGLRSNPDLKIFWPVVAPFPVPVMHHLMGAERPPKKLLHHEPMLSNIPTVDLDNNVAMPICEPGIIDVAPRYRGITMSTPTLKMFCTQSAPRVVKDWATIERACSQALPLTCVPSIRHAYRGHVPMTPPASVMHDAIAPRYPWGLAVLHNAGFPTKRTSC